MISIKTDVKNNNTETDIKKNKTETDIKKNKTETDIKKNLTDRGQDKDEVDQPIVQSVKILLLRKKLTVAEILSVGLFSMSGVWLAGFFVLVVYIVVRFEFKKLMHISLETENSKMNCNLETLKQKTAK